MTKNTKETLFCILVAPIAVALFFYGLATQPTWSEQPVSAVEVAAN